LFLAPSHDFTLADNNELLMLIIVLKMLKYKKSPANANGNTQQPRCMFERPVKQSIGLSQSPEAARRAAAIVSSVLLVLTRGRDVLAQPKPNRLDSANFSYPLSFSALVSGDSFEFMEKLY